MQSPSTQRLRVTFTKTGATRFIGHLDVARTWERALNRAKLPVTYSQGFNRRPKIQFATATSLGMTSECELMDVWLSERMEPALAQAQMAAKMAPGLAVVAVAEVPLSAPALPMLIASSSYTAVIPAEMMPPSAVTAHCQALLEAETLIRQRTSKGKTKEYDLRPLILALHATPTAEGDTTLFMELMLSPTHTGRPDTILQELGLDPLDIPVHRQALVLSQE